MDSFAKKREHMFRRAAADLAQTGNNALQHSNDVVGWFAKATALEKCSYWLSWVFVEAFVHNDQLDAIIEMCTEEVACYEEEYFNVETVAKEVWQGVVEEWFRTAQETLRVEKPDCLLVSYPGRPPAVHAISTKYSFVAPYETYNYQQCYVYKMPWHVAQWAVKTAAVSARTGTATLILAGEDAPCDERFLEKALPALCSDKEFTPKNIQRSFEAMRLAISL